MSVLLEAEAVSVARGKRLVLHDVSLQLRAGEALALVGPNAAGKSTLVCTLAGLLQPLRGQVRLKDCAFGEWTRDAVARSLALVTPEEGGPHLLTVTDRVALGRYPHRGPFRPLTTADEAAVEGALRRTGIEHLAHRRLDTLSAGERQLAALARGLAQEPEVLLLDEPSAHLDIGHQLRLFRVLDEVRECGVAVLAVIHELQRAASWASRMVLLHEGRIVAEGSPPSVLGSDQAARAFDVTIRSHSVPGLAHLLYSYAEGEAPGSASRP